jgi:gliding motility-associated lipoprotein GldH
LIRFLFISSIFLAGLTSCHNDVLVSQEWKWDTQQWIVGDAKIMKIEAADTTSRYAMDLDLAWDKSFGFENLYIRTKTVFPSGKEVTSVTSLELEETDGTWAGKCSGSTCSLSFPLQKVFTFPEVGSYSWSIEPYMRVDTVQGIKSLRVTCRKLKK